MAPAPIPAPRASGFTQSTDVPLYWCAYGPAGAPRERLLVLHGGPGADHAYLLPQMLALTPEFELIFYDQRGGGRSKESGATTVAWGGRRNASGTHAPVPDGAGARLERVSCELRGRVRAAAGRPGYPDASRRTRGFRPQGERSRRIPAAGVRAECRRLFRRPGSRHRPDAVPCNRTRAAIRLGEPRRLRSHERPHRRALPRHRRPRPPGSHPAGKLRIHRDIAECGVRTAG